MNLLTSRVRIGYELVNFVMNLLTLLGYELVSIGYELVNFSFIDESNERAAYTQCEQRFFPRLWQLV